MMMRSSFLSSTMIRKSLLTFTLALLFQVAPHVDAGSIDVSLGEGLQRGNLAASEIGNDPPRNITRKPLPPFPPTAADREKEKQERIQRHRERRTKAKETLKNMGPKAKESIKNIRPENLQEVSEEEIKAMGEDHPALRGLWGRSGSGSTIEYADPGVSWDMWQQGYRMLGGFIDCDHDKDGDGSGSGDGGDQSACSRWMMWASYIDPNYQGNEYYEYHGDEPTGVLDCHDPNTEWILLGVYRQEFYQFIEQISKHLWAIDEYEYVVALAGLAYMTDYDCFYVGTTDDGDYIYAGVAPEYGGSFRMALYTDEYCLTPNDNLGMTFDDFGLTSDMSLGSGDNGDDYDGDSYEWWVDAQEYSLTMLNEVYEDFKYCTSCIDYPTYQDGYYIGDDGTDEDDLINQCWKFYSHDSFNCESDCIALGHSQGTITSVVLDGNVYGEILSDFYTTTQEGTTQTVQESSFSRLLANAFVTFSFIVFVATFLAFAVARRSRYRESRSSKSRRLLDDEDDNRSPRSRRSTRSKSQSRKDEEGDGLFRTSNSRKSRSKSGSKRSKSGRSKSAGRGDRERTRDRDDDYEPPRSSRSSRSKRSASKSRRQHIDDF